MLNEDYKEMLHALSEEKVKFLLVGAYALAAHGYPRATMDIDIWIMPSPQNADAVLRALLRFGAPLHHLTKEDLQRAGTIFQIGVAPRRIDIITTASGLEFEETYQRSLSVNIEGIEVHIPSDRRPGAQQEGIGKNQGSGRRRGIGIPLQCRMKARVKRNRWCSMVNRGGQGRLTHMRPLDILMHSGPWTRNRTGRPAYSDAGTPSQGNETGK